MEPNRQKQIHEKGFDMYNLSNDPTVNSAFGKIKVGVKNLDDAVIQLGELRNKTNRFCFSKQEIIDAIIKKDLPKLRDISNTFYRVSGIYQRACDYYANLYRYDWYIAPESFDPEKIDEKKIVSDFIKKLNFLDNSHIKKLSEEISLKVVLNGVYYGYIIPTSNGMTLQDLPVGYCRSRFSVNGLPTVEFNMSYFDEAFPDTQYRLRVLKMFPKEFQKGYLLYKQGKLASEPTLLEPQRPYDNFWKKSYGWYLLEPGMTVKFNLNNTDCPIFISAIPAILDLDEAQDLDRRKQMQKLLKILIQKLPLDKNGDLIFDVEEAQDIHNNVVNMLKRAIGVDVVTTFADVESIDLSDKNTTATQDDIAKVERTVYNALGLSKNLFNTDGNLSLTKSILEDESTMRNFVLQLQTFFDRILNGLNGKSRKNRFRFYMLETTQYNYQEISKMYKEQTQIGFSKMLPQIALGHSQSAILGTAFFENKILELSSIMIPPLMSSTMSGEDILGKKDQSTSNENKNSTEDTNDKVEVVKTDVSKGGRPEKSEDQKSDKTIQNTESMS